MKIRSPFRSVSHRAAPLSRDTQDTPEGQDSSTGQDTAVREDTQDTVTGRPEGQDIRVPKDRTPRRDRTRALFLRVPKDKARVSQDTKLGPARIPGWVLVFTDWGRPIVAVVVMIMCAPGEHHLARLSGWHGQLFGVDLAWGMAVCLVSYAGIAAVVATKRPKGAQGKRSAIVGAVVALIMAMSAQVFSHLFMTNWLSATPRTPWALVIAASCVPPLVLGHLFHLAASSDVVTSTKALSQDTGQQDSRTAGQQDTQLAAVDTVSQDMAQDTAPAGQGHGYEGFSVQDPWEDTELIAPAAAPAPAKAVPAVSRPSTPKVSQKLPTDQDTGQDMGQDTPVILPRLRKVSQDTHTYSEDMAGTSWDTQGQPSVSGHVLSLLLKDSAMSRDAVRTSVRDLLGQSKTNAAIDKAFTRARSQLGITAS